MQPKSFDLDQDPVPPFPSKTRRQDKGGRVTSEEFLIPEDRKQAYLDEHYPFEGVPNLSDRKYDLHANMHFIVRDYMLVRENGTNFIVSPYYYESGGTVIDWMPPRHSNHRAE